MEVMTKAEREIRKMLEVAENNLFKLWGIPKDKLSDQQQRELIMHQTRVNAYKDCLIYSGLREGWGIEQDTEE
jgi:hypothetical protein